MHEPPILKWPGHKTLDLPGHTQSVIGLARERAGVEATTQDEQRKLQQVCSAPN